MPPHVRQKYMDIVRAIPPGRKLKSAFELSDLVREMMLAGVRSRYPGISDEQARMEVIRQVLPPDLLRKAYGR